MMIDIEKACEIATTQRNKPFVDVITDIGSGFVIGIISKDGEVAEQFPVLVHKDSGKAEPFRVPEHLAELKTGKTVNVPSKYKFRK